MQRLLGLLGQAVAFVLVLHRGLSCDAFCFGVYRFTCNSDRRFGLVVSSGCLVEQHFGGGPQQTGFQSFATAQLLQLTADGPYFIAGTAGA